MTKVLIDIGSSTIKAYRQTSETLMPLVQRSLNFKDGFDPEGGITGSAKKGLFEFIESVQEQNEDSTIKIYATGIFRKLAPAAKISFGDEFFMRTGLFFNIISQDLENFYLEMALIGKCSLNEPILLINIGGASTELVVIYEKEAIERKNIDLGVGTINSKFSNINEPMSGVALKTVVDFIKGILPSLLNKTKIAFYTGGELTYMRLANYPLENNKIFKDADHPSMISVMAFFKKNEEIYEKVRLGELEALFPENPKWTHGARGCSAIAQAICEKYDIKIIVPSDSNLINGITRQEFRYVTISGSFRKHLDYILGVRKQLIEEGGRGA